ncbi:hypothetical protein [Deferrisoma camini]|uniref:hypothetical protein n=1 Tax=Deferrisoma camini TaxID=1035120 RepID=UPI00046D5350|nr:hypothetical protein [Deferrisoma camini]
MTDESSFRPAGTLPGRLYVPAGGGPKKHPCPECYCCQWCPEVRCQACRSCPKAGPDPEDQATNR